MNCGVVFFALSEMILVHIDLDIVNLIRRCDGAAQVLKAKKHGFARIR